MSLIHEEENGFSVLRRVLPRSLLGRSLVIIVTPLIILQVVSAWAFYERHWDNVTKRLANSVGGDIAAVIDLRKRLGPEYEKELFRIAEEDVWNSSERIVRSVKIILPKRAHVLDSRLHPLS